MPPRKKITKVANNNSVKGKVEQNKVLIQRTERVPVSSLKMYHKNPRVGNVDLIAKSLHLNGQFKPIVVNIGTHTGRPNEILAGNHTWLGARRDVTWDEQIGDEIVPMHKDQWESIVASFVDVDEQQAAKIVLVDNKAADEGTYDDAIIAELFRNLPDVAGTGFSNMEVDDILAQASRVIEETTANSQADLDSIMANMPDPTPEEAKDTRTDREKYKAARSEEQADAANTRGASNPEPEAPDDEDILAGIDVAAEVQVVLEAREENLYIGDNDWGIPELLPDLILDKFPSPIQTWGGKEATPDDGKKWFLYNYSLGGMTGLPMDRTILAFNTYDAKFINWWETPAYYTAKFIAKGLKIAVVPDFSFYYTESRTHHLWGVYRAQWLGRFFQEAGIKVVPRLQFDFRDPKSLEIALLGIPENTPTLECSIQNVNDEPDQKIAAKMLRDALEQIQPKQFLVYGGNPGWKIAQESGWGGEMIHAMNYSGVRRGTVFDKKEGSKALTAKQRKAIREKHGIKSEDSVKQEVPNDDDL